MNQPEHTQEATELVRRAHEESTNGGNERIAAELLWGAFAHCLIAVAQNEELPHDSHGAFRTIARHMDAAQDSNDWRSRLGAAENLHHHFYHGDLPAQELRTHRRRTREGTLELCRAAVEALEGLDGWLSVRHEGRVLAAQEAPPAPAFFGW